MNQRTRMTIVYAGMYIFCSSGLANGGGSPYRFAMIDLGDLGGDAANVFALDSRGNAVGSAWFPGNETSHAVKFQLDGDPIDLGSFEGDKSVALGVNEIGEVAGWSDDAGGHPKPTLWRNDEMIDLGTLGGTGGYAYDVNTSTVVVGSSWLPDNFDRLPFRWENGVMTQLPTHEGFSEARDINDAGQIVGYTIADDYPRRRAALWENGELIDLPPLSGTRETEAWAINEHGQVVGYSDDADNGGNRRAVLWENGDVVPIQPIANNISWTSAYSINNRTQVVGRLGFKYREPKYHAFYWQESTGMKLMMDLVPPNSGLQIDAAYGINDNTEIAARAWRLKDGWYRALLLIPVDPELTLSDPVPGIAGQRNTWTITGANPGSKITFAYSAKGGGTLVPGCDKLDAVVQLKKPKVMKTVTADANGEATIEMFVPAAARNLGDILFQAVSVQDCEESQLSVFRFQ